MYIDVKNKQQLEMLKENTAYLEKFCNPSELTFDTEISLAEEAMSAVVTGASILLPMAGLVNVEAETRRLTVEAKKLEAEVRRSTSKLANEKFISKAPTHLVEEEREKLADYKTKLTEVTIRLEALKN